MKSSAIVTYPDRKPFLQLGNSFFYNLTKEKISFVDKSLFIKDLIDDETPVKLILRPRSCGANFNLTMLKCFFSNNIKSTINYFEKLKITNEHARYYSETEKSPLIDLSFITFSCRSYKEFIENFQYHFAKLYMDFEDELGHTIANNVHYNNIIQSTVNDPTLLSKSLFYLCEYLYKKYNKKVMIIFKGYDLPVSENITKPFLNKIVDFLHTLFNDTFKDNPYLKSAIITGTLPLKTIYTDLVNIGIYDVFDEKYSSYFGFTEQEVRELVSLYFPNATIDFAKLERYYGGYRIGNNTIYNPILVTDFLNSYSRLQSIGCSSCAHIPDAGSQDGKHLFTTVAPGIKIAVEQLLKSETVYCQISDEINDNDLSSGTISLNESAFWRLLNALGAISWNDKIKTKEGTFYKIHITNKHYIAFFESLVELWHEPTEEKKQHYFKNR